MRDWFSCIAMACIVGIIVALVIAIAFPEAMADTSGPIKEYYLSDHTRCAVIDSANSVAMSCDWERRNTR